MGNLELCINYAKKRSLELRESFLAESSGLALDELIAGLSGPEREQYEERAAIMEIDGGLPRARAERAALLETLRAGNE